MSPHIELVEQMEHITSEWIFRYFTPVWISPQDVPVLPLRPTFATGSVSLWDAHTCVVLWNRMLQGPISLGLIFICLFVLDIQLHVRTNPRCVTPSREEGALRLPVIWFR